MVDSSLPAEPVAASRPAGGGESDRHLALKRLSAEWARARRLALWATEVRLPRSSYRADVAACTPNIAGASAFTAVFECKASRADFLRDGAAETAVTAEVTILSTRLTELRALIAAHRPDLRRGEELFAAFDCWDLRGLRHDGHDRLTRQLRIAQRKLLEGTKFSKLARWRAATLLYLVSEPGVVGEAEVPDGWGWLEREGDTLALRALPCRNETTPAERITFLERIAAANATRESVRLGLKRPEWLEPTRTAS